MEVQVRVTPERSVRQTGTPNVLQRAKQFASRVVSNGARVIEHVSRLYGYALLIAGVDAFFVTGVSSLPLTKWDSEFVPHADIFVVSVLLGVWVAVSRVERERKLVRTLALESHD